MISAATRTTRTRQHFKVLVDYKKIWHNWRVGHNKEALTTQIDALRELLEPLDKFLVYKKTYYRILDQIALQRSRGRASIFIYSQLFFDIITRLTRWY